MNRIGVMGDLVESSDGGGKWLRVRCWKGDGQPRKAKRGWHRLASDLTGPITAFAFDCNAQRGGSGSLFVDFQKTGWRQGLSMLTGTQVGCERR
ncbi:MAG: hypothetical protein ACKN81_14580, partial [Pirellulaceae bacterium]